MEGGKQLTMEEGKQLTMEEGKQLTMEEGKQLTMEEGKQLTMEEGKQLTMEEENHPCRRRRMDQEENNSPKLHAAVNHINDLPPTILVYILRQLRMCDLLHRASLVCKLWHQLVYDPDLWRRIDLKYQHKVTDTQLLTLTQISDRVTHIDISYTLNLTSEAVEHALKCCTHLRSLHMSSKSMLYDGILEVVGKNCHRLQTLVMDSSLLTDRGLLQIAQGCPDLRKINFALCGAFVTDNGVLAITENCPRLKEVMLGYLSKVTDTSCVRLCEMCPDLEVVSLVSSGVGQKGVQALTKLRKLKVLDISSLPGISPADVASLTKYCPDLEEMNVSGNPQIDDACLLQVVKYGHKLHLLKCATCHVTDHFMSEVGKLTNTLKNLDIGWCQVTDDGIRTLSATCQSLQYLGLIQCSAVTAATMEELMAKYPQIKYRFPDIERPVFYNEPTTAFPYAFCKYNVK